MTDKPPEVFCFFHGHLVRSCIHIDTPEIKKLNDVLDWINTYADQDKHPEAVIDNTIQPYGRGYKDCVIDVIEKLKETFKDE